MLVLAAELPAEDVRFISRTDQALLAIDAGVPIFGIVADTLGVTPDSRVKVLFCVEGPTDVKAFKALSHALHISDQSIPDLTCDDRVAFVVLGGGTLIQWVSEHYLRALHKPELHIYDSDVPAYEVAQAVVNGRNDGSHAFRTAKHELECYLHPDAINEAFGVMIDVLDQPATPGDSVGKRFAQAYSTAQGFDGVMRETVAKRYLAEQAFPRMNAARIVARDPSGEVQEWFNHLRKMLNATPGV